MLFATKLLLQMESKGLLPFSKTAKSYAQQSLVLCQTIRNVCTEQLSNYLLKISLSTVHKKQKENKIRRFCSSGLIIQRGKNSVKGSKFQCYIIIPFTEQLAVVLY